MATPAGHVDHSLGGSLVHTASMGRREARRLESTSPSSAELSAQRAGDTLMRQRSQEAAMVKKATETPPMPSFSSSPVARADTVDDDGKDLIVSANGAQFLVEKATGAVYATDGAAGHPSEVGRWDGASIVFHSDEDGEAPVPLPGALRQQGASLPESSPATKPSAQPPSRPP